MKINFNELIANLKSEDKGIIFYDGSNRVKKSFSETYTDVKKCVSLLKDKATSDDCALIFGNNCYEWAVYDLACIALGIKTIPVPNKETLLSKLDDSRVKVVITDYKKLETSLEVFDFNSYKDCEEATVTPYQYEEDETFSTIFTSGTTGVPKSIEVNKKSFDLLCSNGIEDFMISSNDKIIAFLPLSTYLQRVYIYMSIILKADVVISNAFMVFDHIKREKPTIFIAIPYLYSSVEQNFMTAINKNKKGKRFLKLYSFLKKLGLMKRFKPFADVWGGNIRILASGSSPLQMTTYDFYEKMGIPIYQAYGMNEVGILTSNTPKHNKKGSVGRPCNGMKITISDDEEIIVESEYSTNSEYGDGKAFAVDNKIHTNDLGHIDKDGFVFITGRKNNTIVLANGKKVMPETEESVLEKFQEVTNALVYSEDKVSLKAVVSITEDSNEQELVKAFKGLQREGKLSSEIFAFEIIREGFSSKNNLLTPNMKKNRKYKQSTTAELVS